MATNLLKLADEILARNPGAEQAPVYEGAGNTLSDSLRKGWSSGIDTMGADVNQIVGLGAEAMGADNFAQGRYRTAQGLREDAQRNAPSIHSLDQVDGVGNALRWGVGQIGAMGPTALGVVGGTVATGNPFVGGALAMGLPEAGDIAYRQTLDPQTMEQSAGTRLTKALAGGAASGAVQAAGPGLLMGKVAKGAGAGLVKQSTGQIIGRNFAEGVGVNALAEGGSEAIKQFAANPDAPFNMGAIGESALAGGVLGVPFGALGAGVDIAKASPGKTWIGAKKVAQGGVENARSALNGVGEALGSTGEALAPAWEAVKGHVDAGMAAAQTGAKDAWAAMPDGLKGVGEFVKTGVEDQIASARTAYKNIMSDADTPAALKEQAQEWGSNLASTANRAYLWSADKMRGAGEKAKAAAPEDVVGRLREFSKPAGDMLDTILNSESMADTREFAGKTLDQAKEMLKGRKEQATKWLGPKMDELMDRADVSDERKQQIADLRNNIGDLAAQAKAATILKAQKLADAAKPKLDAAYKKVEEAYSKLFPEDPNVKKSDDHSGMNALIFDKIGPMIKEAKPELLEDADSTMKLGSTLRMFMKAAAEGKDLRVAGIHTEMVDLLGPDLAHDVLNAAHEFATGGDQTKQANYFKHLTDSVKEKASMDNLETVITKSLSNEASGRTGVTANPRELAKYLRGWARGDYAVGKPREQVEYEDQEVQKFLETHFGTNAQKIRDALQKDVEGERGKQKAGIGEEGGMDFESTGEYDTNVSYHGVKEVGDTPKLYESDRSVKNNGGGGQYGSAVEQAIKKLKAEHPDMSVSFVKLTDYAKAHNLNEEQIARLAEGKDPSQHGFIKKERIKNDDGLEGYQLRGMRGKIKSDKHPDAIGVEGRSENYAYDSRRIANVMRKAAGTERSDFEVAHGFRGQLAQKFAEGIAKLTAHEGRNLKVRDDHVIGKVGGKDLTWGEARSLLADKPLLRTEADKASDAHRDTVERLRKHAKATAKDRKASRDEQKAAWRDYYDAERKGDFKRDVELTSEGRTADLESRLSKALMKRDEEMRDYGITSVDDPAISEHQAKVDQLRDKLNDAKFEDWYSSEDGVNAREGRRESSPTEDVVQRAGKDHGQNDMERANYNPAADNTMRDKPLFSPIDGALTASGKDVLRMKLDRMKSSAVTSTRELAPKIEALMKVSDSLDEAERKTLGAAVYADAKNIKAITAAIGKMYDTHAQYAEVTAKYGKGQEFDSPESPLLNGPQDLADRTAKYGKSKAAVTELVDKVILSENYPTTVAGTEKFLNAAKKRFEALQAEDRRVLNDDDHPTQRLPEAEQKVLDALHQTFDKNSDLAPFFTELDGWDAVPEAEQIRLMKFAEGLTGSTPNPKQVAAKKAASFGNDADVSAQGGSSRVANAIQRGAMARSLDRVGTPFEHLTHAIKFVAEDGPHRGMTHTSDGLVGVNFTALHDSSRWAQGMSVSDRLDWVMSHELGHVHDIFQSQRDGLDHLASRDMPALDKGGWSYAEAAAARSKDPLLEWAYKYPLDDVGNNHARELYAQHFALFNHNPELMREHLPKTYEAISRLAAGGTEARGTEAFAHSGAGTASEGRSAARDNGAARERLLDAARANDPALLKELSTSDDAKGLQRAVEALYDVVGADEALQAANKRLSELVQDPDVAYGLQTKKYSLESTAIHDDLGRDGFAATHDSPYKFDGVFNWEANSGKGEGGLTDGIKEDSADGTARMAGAGTYLSTSDGSHRWYKTRFTGVIAGEVAGARLRGLEKNLARAKQELGFLPSKAGDAADSVRARIADLEKAIDAIPKSPTYHVSVDIKPEQLLDWNKPLSKQSDLVQEALRMKIASQRTIKEVGDALRPQGKNKYGEELETGRILGNELRLDTAQQFSGGVKVYVSLAGDKYMPAFKGVFKSREEAISAIAAHVDGVRFKNVLDSNPQGELMYAMLAKQLGSEARASIYLRSKGVLGNVHDAQHGSETNHRNYVIYDDSKITTNFVHFDAQKSAGTPLTAKGRAQILAYLNTATPWVQAEFPFLSHAGEFTKEFGQAIVRVSTHALNPTSVAYHESLHAFFQHLKENSSKDISQVVMDAASSPAVTSQLRKLLAHSPEALKQLSDPEERAAYMYQFWADGKLTLAEKPTTLFQKITAAFRKVLGIWSNDERALHIMEYFHSGEYAQNVGKQSAVRAALMEKGHNTAVDKMQEMGSKFMEVGDALWGAGSARLRDSKSEALHELADLMKRKGTDVGEDRGYIPAARLKRTEFITQMAEGLAGADETVLHEALEALQGGTKPSSLEARRAYASVRKVLDDVFDYLHRSGVDTGDLGYGKDYFPRHWDSNYLSKHEAEFMAMARKYPQWADAKDTYNKLLANDGSELRVADRPGMQANKRRVLSFIADADAAPFMSKNLPEIMNGYITQATRRGEWARRFGDDNARMGKLLDRARREGASKAEIAHAQDFVAGVNGTLGDDLNPTLRRYMGNMVVYQNIRLLPLAIFSSVVDPMGVMVRGGTVGNAWSTFKRGIREVPAGLKGREITDYWTGMAQALGTIDNASLQHALGSLYTQGMVGGTAKKINDTFFKYNLMEQFNQSMRVGATEAAVGFITKHADGKASQHSIRWIAELGLRGGDVKVTNGRMATTVAEGLTEAQAARVKSAINQWVDGAVLRPDAADKPTWMNDPHFMLISHLKQFVYSFHHTILDRVMHEMKHQNYAPAIALSSYVPIMIAADMLKGLIQGGGSEPEWKRAWGPGEYLENGVERAGLFGVGQFGVDALQGNFGSLAGPTLGQMADGFEVLDGVKQFKTFAIHSLPANQLYAGALRAGAEDPKFVE